MRAFVYQEGKAAELPFAEAATRTGLDELIWLHLDGTKPASADWLANHSALPDYVQSALLAKETRPRGEVLGGGALLNLRGGRVDDEDGSDLVSVRIWAEKGRCVTLSYRNPRAVEEVVDQFLGGEIRDPGDLLIAFANSNCDFLDPQVGAIADALDQYESELSKAGRMPARRAVSRLRANAIHYRRFIAPQRQALEKLAYSALSWLDDDDRAHLRDASDRTARIAEELEAARERAALLHEELTDLRTEQMDSRALLISIVALVFLPLTFFTGLLGMNVRGIPYAEEPWAFWGVVGFCVITGLMMIAYFAYKHWIPRS